MDAFTSFSDSQSSSRNRWNYITLKNRHRWNYNTLNNFREISLVVQNHIKQVYLVSSCAVVVAAVGAYLHLLWNIGGFLTAGASLGSIIWLLYTPPYEEKKRVSLLLASSLFQGASIGLLIDLAIHVDPRLIVIAFVGTSLAFA
ncbi:hypothetical protein QN277_005066 [Acacia crassicarpa]|uniref:Bax inhibitor 1 n=1 Tax=Acacia crassicarpa TaxID=499986 RepID=A0AAE1IVM1_9FABA|nr:hypothetical protein QN277_005066 [Acacia crassicarpa]